MPSRTLRTHNQNQKIKETKKERDGGKRCAQDSDVSAFKDTLTYVAFVIHQGTTRRSNNLRKGEFVPEWHGDNTVD
jgi:hypothetical protein